MGSAPPVAATDAVLVTSQPVPADAKQVRGIDWDFLPDEQRTVVANFVDNLTGQGFQSSSIGDAIRIINDMVRDIDKCFECDLMVSREHGRIPRQVTRPPSFWAILQT